MESNRYYLDGPGETLVVATDFDVNSPDSDKIIGVITAKRASFSTTVTEEKVTGGRSFVPRRKFLTEKTVEFELEDCENDFRYFSLTSGGGLELATASKKKDVWVFGSDSLHTVPSSSPHSIQLGNEPKTTTVGSGADQVTSTMLIIKDSETGEILTPKSVGSVGNYDYELEDDDVTFETKWAGKVVEIIYQYESTTATEIGTRFDDIPSTVKLVHNMTSFDENNKKVGTQQIEIFKAQASAEFSEAYEEKSPFSPTLKFELIDAKRPDGLIMARRFIPVAATSTETQDE